MKPIFGPELRLWLSVALALCGFTPTQAEELPLKPGMTFKDCATDCPEMVVIPAGSFPMGSTADESGHKPTEEPEHKVTIAKPFAVSKFAVTFAEWDACAANGDCAPHVSDGGWGRDRQPVINVSWNDAPRYLTWLSRITGKTYRLLIEAEYEYAARAGTQTFACCYGLARVARVWKISRASVYRSLKETPPNTSARRPGPVGACSDAELADHIRRQIDASRLHGEGYRKLWARLRFAGVRASPRRVRRVMRENGLLAPHRVLRTEAKLHDGTIVKFGERT